MNDDDTDKQTAENGDDGRDGSGRFAPGGPGGPGRPAGAANKITASLRELVERSVHERHPDGALAWLNSLPDDVFVRLADKLLPRDKHLEVTGRDYKIQIVSYAQTADGRPLLQGVPADGEANTPGLT